VSLAEQFAADAAAAPAAKSKSVASQFAADSSASPSAAPSPYTGGFLDSVIPESWKMVSPAQRSQLDSMKATGEQGGMSGIAQAGAHAITGAGSSLYGLVRGLGAMAGGGSLEDASNEIHDAQDKYTYEPPAGSAGAQLLGAASVPLSALARGTNSAGDATLSATGSPLLATVADVGLNTAVTMGAGKLLGGRLPTRAGQTPLQNVGALRVEPTMEPLPAPTSAQPLVSPDLSQAPQSTVPAKSAPFPATEPVASPTAAANEPTVSDAPNGVFAKANPDAPGGLPPQEQQRRAQVLQQIGLDNVRTSAITGDAGAASTDFQTSRLDSPAGALMKNTLTGEKSAIGNYAEGIIQKTGGSTLNDQSAKYARGGTILAPLDALKSYYDTQTSALYKTADERAQGVPTQLDQFRTVLGDDSQLTNSDRINLQTAASAYARRLGIMSDDGSVFANAQQAETMRKYLNENWSPQNSGFVGKLKDALDDDVTQAAGEDVYAQARSMRAQRAATLDNPNGIANLMDASGPNQINRKVPVERVADTVANMPVDQLSHVVETLKNVPDVIQPQAQAALAEIKAQYAHNVSEIGSKQAGQWNAKGVQQYLNSNSARMKTVFDPEEMQPFGTLNDAGNILAKDQSYPGAAAQSHNLIRAGVTHSIQAGGAGIGGVIGGPIGSMVGGAVGNSLAGKFNDAAALRSAQKRMTKLSDIAPD
jgi:hypothetical protein